MKRAYEGITPKCIIKVLRVSYYTVEKKQF